MNASLSTYVPGVGRVASKPVGDVSLDPPDDTDAELRLHWELTRHDSDDALDDDLAAAIDTIYRDEDKVNRLRYYLRHGAENNESLGRMLRVAVMDEAEAWVESHFAQLKERQRMGDLP